MSISENPQDSALSQSDDASSEPSVSSPSRIKQASWQTAFEIGLATFGILALELALIRWTSSQIRSFAYFNNLVLIGAFLGMGLGVALGPRRPGLLHWTMPVLLVLAVPLAFSESLNLVHLPFTDQSVYQWGAGQVTRGWLQILGNMLIFFSLFGLVVVVFLCAGTAVGALFSRLPTMRAYLADLVGSLLGIICFTLVTFLYTTPPTWFALGCFPFLWLSRRKWLSLLSGAGVLVLAWFSMGSASYSPYNRIDLRREKSDIYLSVNRDFHQYMHDLSDKMLQQVARHNKADLLNKTHFRRVYDLPFQINKVRERALIVGAGTGNDVQAALRNHYRKVYSVDIDARIMQLGKSMHPERPYDDKRVVPVVNDARAFFQQYRGAPFDVICFGLLDSHAMFSAMSSLRLDNYVYTEQGIRAAWRHVSAKGHLSLSFSMAGGQWLFDRLFYTIQRATGIEPIAFAHGMHSGVTFLVMRDKEILQHKALSSFPRVIPQISARHVQTTSDDWPFLYIQPGTFPWGYLIILTAVLLLAWLSTSFVFGFKNLAREFDLPLFLMGAAFLLLETRGVTSLALLFGSTWVVNAAVFAGIMLVVLLGSVLVFWKGLRDPMPWFVLLICSILLLYVIDLNMLNHLSLLPRGILGGLLNALPIAFAGVIVPILLLRSPNPTASLGANLLGAVVGGSLEYLSMYFGLRVLLLLALSLYLAALLGVLRKKRVAGI